MASKDQPDSVFRTVRFCLAVKSSHGHLDNNESSRADRHSSRQGRSDTLPEASRPLSSPSLCEAISHSGVFLVGTEAVGLHLALDDIEGIAGKPENFTSKTTVKSNLVSRDILAVDLIASSVRVHHILKGSEPGTVGESLSPDGDSLTAVDATQNTIVS